MDRSADVQFNLGHVYLSLLLYDSALKSFNRARELDPLYPEIDYSLAEALFGLGRINDALSSASEANQSTPHDLDAWLLRARCEERLGLHEQAGQTYQHLLKLEPDHIDGQLALARRYASRFMTDEASVLLDKLLDNNNLPNSALVQIGDAYGGIMQAAKAVKTVKTVVERDPTDSAAHAVLGSAYIDMGEFELSEQHLREALRHDPRQALAYQSLADIKRLVEADRTPLETLYKTKHLDNRKPDAKWFCIVLSQ